MMEWNVLDRVYVYKKSIFNDANFAIDSNMIGTVISVDDRSDEDFMGQERCFYKIKVELDNGRNITVREDATIFNRYKMVSLNELLQFLEHSITDVNNGLKIKS